MAKKRCKLAKEDFHIKKPKEFKKLVDNPEYVCEKCGRVANKKIHLCKPEKLG